MYLLWPVAKTVSPPIRLVNYHRLIRLLTFLTASGCTAQWLWANAPTNSPTQSTASASDGQQLQPVSRARVGRGSREPVFIGTPLPSDPIDDGWLFVNGEYIPPPYVVAENASGIRINDYSLEIKPTASPQSRRRGRRWSEPSPASDLIYFLKHDGGLVLVWDGHEPAKLDLMDSGLNLLAHLIQSDRRRTTDVESVIAATPDSLQETIGEWIVKYTPPSTMTDRAAATIREIRDLEEANDRAISARQWLERMNYPLSIFAMLTCAGAAGHLLRGNHEASAGTATTDDRNRVYLSLGFSMLFSLHDLTCTLLALAAGAMREMNPIAASLSSNPQLLVVFKIGLTVFGVTIMAAFWRHSIARRASWWTCLILALLTARWLTFSAVFG